MMSIRRAASPDHYGLQWLRWLIGVEGKIDGNIENQNESKVKNVSVRLG
jgi:hypothetical protein